MLSEAQIDNQLVAMKDRILQKVWSIEKLEDFSDVLSRLVFVAGLWEHLGYAYKGAEICRSAMSAMRLLVSDLPPQAYRKRQNAEYLIKQFGFMEQSFRDRQQQYWDRQTNAAWEKYKRDCLVQI